MMSCVRTLVVLAVLCRPSTSLCLRWYQTQPSLLCNSEMGQEAPGDPMSQSWASLFKTEDDLSAESREKRTSPPSSYRYLSQTQLRSKMFQNSARTDRRSRVTLSLDVPTNIMNILFDIAKSKNLRAKAADNARLMAQIGRRK